MRITPASFWPRANDPLPQQDLESSSCFRLPAVAVRDEVILTPFGPPNSRVAPLPAGLQEILATLESPSSRVTTFPACM